MPRPRHPSHPCQGPDTPLTRVTAPVPCASLPFCLSALLCNDIFATLQLREKYAKYFPANLAALDAAPPLPPVGSPVGSPAPKASTVSGVVAEANRRQHRAFGVNRVIASPFQEGPREAFIEGGHPGASLGAGVPKIKTRMGYSQVIWQTGREKRAKGEEEGGKELE